MIKVPVVLKVTSDYFSLFFAMQTFKWQWWVEDGKYQCLSLEACGSCPPTDKQTDPCHQGTPTGSGGRVRRAHVPPRIQVYGNKWSMTTENWLHNTTTNIPPFLCSKTKWNKNYHFIKLLKGEKICRNLKFKQDFHYFYYFRKISFYMLQAIIIKHKK